MSLQSGFIMAQSTYQFVMKELAKTPLTLREVADSTKIPYSTLKRIARGGNASVHRFDQLAAFFRSAEQHRKAS